MPFCPKCGNQVPDGAQFCANCGNSFASVQQPAYTPAPPPVRAPRPQLVKIKSDVLKDKKSLFRCGAVVLLLLALIFSLCNIIRLHIIGYTEHVTLIASERDWAAIIIIIFSVIGILSANSRMFFSFDGILDMIIEPVIAGCSFISLLFMLIGLWSARGEVNGSVRVSLGFIGWIALLFFLGAIALSLLVFLPDIISKKRTAPAKVAPQYNAPQYNAPQYNAPQYNAPQQPVAPQYNAPQYNAPQQPVAPQYNAPQQPVAPQYNNQQGNYPS